MQRVTRAAVAVDCETIAAIGPGMLVFLGVTHTDTRETAAKVAARCVGLRIFDDAEGRMNLAIGVAGGEVLCVSQFTLYGDVRRGNRPSYAAAASGDVALPLYEAFCEAISAAGVPCARGRFGATMTVELANDGPVSIWMDSDDLAAPRRLANHERATPPADEALLERWEAIDNELRALRDASESYPPRNDERA